MRTAAGWGVALAACQWANRSSCWDFSAATFALQGARGLGGVLPPQPQPAQLGLTQQRVR